MADIDYTAIPCPTCPARSGEMCVEPRSWLLDPKHPTYLASVHPSRIESVAFDAALTQPGDNHPITAALIDGADVV